MPAGGRHRIADVEGVARLAGGGQAEMPERVASAAQEPLDRRAAVNLIAHRDGPDGDWRVTRLYP